MSTRNIPASLNRAEFEAQPSCLLCSEATAKQCHRRLVAERLAAVLAKCGYYPLVRKSIVITDLTRMQHGRVCVAGYDADVRCIRPVLGAPGIFEHGLYKDGNPVVFPAAEVEYDFIERTPEPPHTEDARYEPNSVRFVRRLTVESWRELLEQTAAESVQAIFGQPILAGPGHFVPVGQGTRSLGTIEAPAGAEVVYRQRADGIWDYRLGFDDARGAHYRLPVVDLVWRYFLDSRRDAGRTARRRHRDRRRATVAQRLPANRPLPPLGPAS